MFKFGMLHFSGLGSVPGYGCTPLICQWLCCDNSSHPKRGRLAVDVSLGQIFLSKKKRKKKKKIDPFYSII